MNFLKNILFMIASVLIISSLAFASCDSNQFKVSVTNTTYNVERGQTIDVEFSIVNCTDQEVFVLSQIKYDDEDDMDYFDPTFSSKDLAIESGQSSNITYKVHIDDDTPSDDYKLFFDFYYTPNEKVTKSIKVIVEDFDDFDITLEDDTLCKGEPLETYLIFNNDTGHQVLIDPKVTSDSLWPKVHSDMLILENNKETKVKISFNKDVTVGEYSLKVENQLYLSNSSQYFRKDLKVEIKNCDSTALELSASNMGSIVRGENANLQYYLYNDSDKDVLVQFSYENIGGDYAISQVNNDAVVEAGSSITNTIIIGTNANTLSGAHTVKIVVYGASQTLTRTVNFNVVNGNVEITYDPISAKNSLKNAQNITIKNNSVSAKTLTVLVENTNGDSVYPETATIVVDKGSEVNLKVFIIPNSTGIKTYDLILKNSSEHYSKEIYYNSTEYFVSPTFVTKYDSKIDAEKNRNFNLKVEVENPYDISIGLLLSVDSGTGSILSGTRSLILGPKEKQTVDIPVFISNANAGEYVMSLVTQSEMGVSKNPIYLTIVPTSAEVLPLDVEFPESVYFIPGELTMVPLKITNNNNLDIVDAKLYFDENTYITTTIPANTTKDIEVPLYLEGMDNTAVKLVVVTNDSKVNGYDVLAEPNPNFTSTGLFGLGLGSTIGVIIGLIILALIVLLFIYSNKNKAKDKDTKLQSKL